MSQTERNRRFGATPRGKYNQQKANAVKRGVGFSLSFMQWWRIWQDSGKWHLRGRTAGKYVMARYGDQGAYEPGNVYISSFADNLRLARIKMRRVHTARSTAVLFSDLP